MSRTNFVLPKPPPPSLAAKTAPGHFQALQVPQQSSLPVKALPEAPKALQGEIKIDSPLIGSVEASNGLAYLVAGGLLACLFFFVYLKFGHRHVKRAFKRSK